MVYSSSASRLLRQCSRRSAMARLKLAVAPAVARDASPASILASVVARARVCMCVCVCVRVCVYGRGGGEWRSMATLIWLCTRRAATASTGQLATSSSSSSRRSQQLVLTPQHEQLVRLVHAAHDATPGEV
jgi:hypothetical protein